ncbi:MAG: HD domain-containing protein [Segetibacter sp.]
MLSFSEIQKIVINKLEQGLSPALTYHNVPHTLDVLQHVIAIAEQEGITNEDDLLMLKVSALYHDVGFLDIYSGHEEKSCLIASAELPGYGFSKDQVEKICGMIRATKVPQKPQTRLEEIMCDSDLDYLGRDDFFSIGEGLYKEFLIQKIVSNEREWNELQVRFLESHHYFTNSSKQNRQEAKQLNLEKVKSKLV